MHDFAFGISVEHITRAGHKQPDKKLSPFGKTPTSGPQIPRFMDQRSVLSNVDATMSIKLGGPSIGLMRYAGIEADGYTTES